ncbi:MAG: hypothetical protein ABI175_28640 [Polyangiales bacterium]
MALESCSCGGFLPTHTLDCPHCGARRSSRLVGKLLRIGAGVVGGGTFAMTLMACYGRPHGSYNDNPMPPKPSTSTTGSEGQGEPPPVTTIAPPGSAQP